MFNVLFEETDKYLPKEERHDIRFFSGLRENFLEGFIFCKYYTSKMLQNEDKFALLQTIFMYKKLLNVY